MTEKTNIPSVQGTNVIPGREGEPEKKSRLWFLGPAMVIITMLFMIWLALTDLSQPTSEDEAYEACKRDCPTYNAMYVRIVNIPHTRDYECWCRRGTEPMRIW